MNYMDERIISQNEKLSAVKILMNMCHDAAYRCGWWHDLETGEDLRGKRNVGELIALMHSELSEALEAHRKNSMDCHITHRKGLEVELADAIIRIMDFAGGYDLDIPGAIIEKIAFNLNREDHKKENRAKENGKKI